MSRSIHHSKEKLLPLRSRANLLGLFVLPLVGLLLAVYPVQTRASAAEESQTSSPLIRVQQVRELTAPEAGGGEPVLLQACVSYYDPLWKLLYVQDETGGIAVEPGDRSFETRAGDWVELTGATAWRKELNGPIVLGSSLRTLPRRSVPAARPVSTVDLRNRSRPGDWVEWTGVLRSVEDRRGRILYSLMDAGERIGVMLFTLPQWNRTDLIGAKLQLRGVVAGPNTRSELEGVQLLVAGLDDVRIVEQAEAAFGVPLLENPNPAALSRPQLRDGRVHVRGTLVSSVLGSQLRIRCGTDLVTVRTAQTSTVRPGTIVEVVGFPAVEQTEELTLEDAIYRRVGLDVSGAESPPIIALEAEEDGNEQIVFKSVAAVRDLTAEEAKRGYAVHLRGVITYYDSFWCMLFFQGATEGIYVDTENQPLDLVPGDLVRLDGFTGPGQFAPQIQKPRFEILGQAPMPQPTHARFEELITGKNDSQWVEVEGVVRSVRREEEHAILEVEAAGRGRFKAFLPGFGQKPLPTELVDARVRMQGVCASEFNQNRQILGVQFFVPRLAFVSVIEGDASTAASRPLVPIGSLLQFKPREGLTHRVRVQGTVTLRLASGVMFLQDGQDALWLQSQEVPACEPGDRVEAIGFPVLATFTPALQNAIVRQLDRGPTPKPMPITAAEVLRLDEHTRSADAQLVSIGATLLDQLRTSSDNILVLQEGASIFHAHLERRHGELPVRLLRHGSVLRLSGVCAIESDEWRQPRAFRLLLRSPADVALLHGPSWWNQERLWRVLIVMGVLLLVGCGWVLALRRGIQRQTASIRLRLEQEAALEKRFRDLVEHATEMIFSHDLDARFTSLNPAGERLVGYSADELLGKEMGLIVPAEKMDEAARQRRRILHGQRGVSYESEFRNRDGRSILVEVSSWLLCQNGQPIGFQGIARDITDKRKLEAQLLRSQRMESLGTLASGIAHDLNNILAPVMMGVEVLGSSVQNQDDLEMLNTMKEAAQRGANIVKQVLTFARGVHGQRVALQPKRLLKEIVKIAQETFPRNIVVEQRFAPDLRWVTGDPTQLHQVLLNLAINARDAMPRGGILLVSAENASFTRTDAEGPRPGEYVLFSVQDTGSGIAPEIVDRVFEPFFTTKPHGHGTGLGLSTAAGIVKSHEGSILVESEPGCGSIFKVYIPALLQAAGEPNGEHPARTLPGGQSELILLVDDEESIRSVTRSTLERHGYRVVEAANGQQALEVFSASQHEVRLVLTDLMMPTMDGRTLAQSLRKVSPKTPVLGSSGLQQCSHSSIEDADFITMLSKPYSGTQLLEAVHRCLEDSEAVPGTSG